ncbi:MAG: dTMP kinase [Proteobacteria bacterium]|nr:MAG: dTMP kinase [Pseudomonadota bacterium]
MIIAPEIFTPDAPRGFIVLEGVNGAGKSTLQRELVRIAGGKGLKVVSSFEPGATKIGSALRSLLLEHKADKPHALTELLLFAADRAEHVETLIKPALNQRKLVISDRYFYSTTAFQGYGRGLDQALIDSLNNTATGGLTPDLVILLDLDPAIGLRRNTAQSGNNDAFERETIDFHARLRAGFLKIAEVSSEPFVVVNAAEPPEQVLSAVQPIFERLIAKFQASL